MLIRVLSGLFMLLPLLAQAQTVVKPAKPASAKVAKAHVVEPVVLADLSPEQLAIAQKVSVGTIPCELSATVHISSHATSQGRFLMTVGKQSHVMEPVPTSTGAVRLESATSGWVWLQLSNKSMLMDHTLGKRVADDCMTPGQRLVAEALERSPAPSLLEPLPTAPASDAATPDVSPKLTASATK